MKKIILNFILIFFGALFVYLVSYHFSFFTWFALVPLIIIARNRSFKKVFLSALFVSLLIGFLNGYYIVGYKKELVFGVGLFFASFYFLFIILQRVFFTALKPPFAVLVPPIVGTLLLFLYSFNPLGKFLFDYASHQPRLGPLVWIYGEYGIMFLMFLFNSLLVFIAIQKRKKGYLLAIFLLASVLLVAYFYSFFAEAKGRQIRVALIQGNFPQTWEWRVQNADTLIMERYKQLTWQATQKGADLVIWSEYAIPRDITKEANLQEEISRLAKEANINLIFGTMIKAGLVGEKGEFRKYDTAFVYNRNGEEIGRYDAVRPFFFDKGTLAGDGYQVIETDVGKIGILICYDEYFYDGYKQYVEQGADFFVIIANNNPVGNVSAMYTVTRFSELMAAVNRKYVLRATNNGITQVVDPYGVVIADLEPFQTEILYADIYIE